VVVDGGVAFTDASTVDLNVTATDPATGVSLVALSNDGQSWTTRAYAPTQSWQLATGAGSKTVHVKWRDGYGQWSSPKTDAIVVDTTPATGTVTIAGGATYASGRSVSLATPATDTLSGVSQIALSNDGASWTSKPYAPSIAWTLPATNGNRTVWVKWRNGAGMWSQPRTDSIILDTIAPAATAPLTALQTGSLGSGGPTVGVTWSGNDATSGIARYEVAQSKDGGAFSTIAAAVTNTRLQLSVSDGHRYAFAVRAIDRAGHTSAWSMGPVLRSTVLAESAAGLSYAGAWSTVKGAGFLGGSARVSSTAGASASYTFSGSSVAWLTGRGPTLGRMTVIVDGAVAGTVDLYRSTATFREVVFSKSWATSGSHTIRLVNQGTLGHPGVVLDGLMTLSGRVFGRVVVAR